MQANTSVIKNEAPASPVAWEGARGYADRVLTRERRRSSGQFAAGVAAFLGLLGVLEYALYQMVQNWTVSGIGASMFHVF
jgi:hypothetical protein